MPDFGSPVASSVDTSPTKGFETIKSLMGIQAQRQVLAGQAADVQQKQQDAQQRAAMASVDWSKHTGEDGTLDVGSFSQDPAIRKAAGDYYPEVLSKAAQIKNAQTQAKQSLLTLNKDQLGAFQQTVGALKTDPDVVADGPVGRQKVVNAIQGFGQTYGPDALKAVSPYAAPLTQAPHGKLASVLDHVQMQSVDAGKQMEMQAPTTGTVDTGPVIQPVNIASRYSPTPGAMQPAGPAFGKGLAPTDQPAYRRQVAAATTEGGAGATNDEALYNEITQKGTQAAKLKSLTQDIRTLANEVQTGKYSKSAADIWSAAKQTFGFKSDDDSADTKRQILSKMAAQLKVQSETGASTDAARSGIEAALPDPEHMGPAAVSQAARYVGSLADIDAERSALAQKHRQVSGGKSTGLRETDASFMQHADPRVFEYQGIPAGKERQDFLKQHFKSQADLDAFKAKIAALKGHGALP